MTAAGILVILVTSAAPQTAPAPDAAREAVLHAGQWLERFPEKELRFDAAIGLHGIRQHIDSRPLRLAWDKAVRQAEQDIDSPMLKFWRTDATVSEESSAGWAIPEPGDTRVNTNRVLSEALHCSANGWRPETTAYITGPMRDDGGYQTVHGLWALTIAWTNDCIRSKEFRKASELLLAEIREAQAEAPEPVATLEIDLFAERLLMMLLADPDSAEAPDWAARLLEIQNADGSWGQPEEGVDPYFQYHATMASAWALAESFASQQRQFLNRTH